MAPNAVSDRWCDCCSRDYYQLEAANDGADLPGVLETHGLPACVSFNPSRQVPEEKLVTISYNSIHTHLRGSATDVIGLAFENIT